MHLGQYFKVKENLGVHGINKYRVALNVCGFSGKKLPQAFVGFPEKSYRKHFLRQNSVYSKLFANIDLYVMQERVAVGTLQVFSW